MIDDSRAEIIFKHFKGVDPEFCKLAHKIGSKVWQIEAPSNNQQRRLRLYKTIVSQQLSSSSANAIWQRLEPILLQDNLLIKQPQLLKQAGLSQPKIAYLKGLEALDFKLLNSLNDQDLRSHLLTYKGVGQWTVDMALIFIYQRLDVFSWTDLILRRVAISFYNLENEELLRTKIEKLKPYRSLAALTLWASYDTLN